jgi:hypothetical protein
MRFDSLEEYMGFLDAATREGVRVKAYGGLEVEVPDGYERGKTSGMLDTEAGDQATETPSSDEAPTVAEVAEEREAGEAPSQSDTKSAWEDYADTLGVDHTGMTKAEIIEATKE